jgi:23S rRNA (guanosine2251-2'-O)-methyltransferase
MISAGGKKLPAKEFLHGRHCVMAALRLSRRKVHRILCVDEKSSADARELAKARGLPVEVASKYDLNRWTLNAVHQGIVALVDSIPDWDEWPSDSKRVGHLALALEGILDPHNLGSILRTASFYGIDRIMLDRQTCKPSVTVSKASAGVMEWMWAQQQIHRWRASFGNLLDRLKQQGTILVGTSPKGQSIDSLLPRLSQRNIMLILGNEGAGLSSATMQHCDFLVSIARPGSAQQSQVDSLNVAVAAGVFLCKLTACGNVLL